MANARFKETALKKTHHKLRLCYPVLGSTGNGVAQTKETWTIEKMIVDRREREIADYGTFKDSLRAPVHRWFKYPAGYSYKFVEAKIKQGELGEGNWILDPFAGSGTTLVEGKRHNINSVGIEPHPFVAWVARVKTNWNINLEKVIATYYAAIETAKHSIADKHTDAEQLPELVHKCYSRKNLESLVAIRDAIKVHAKQLEIRDFLNLALADTLRNASKAATGWPYVSPSKFHAKVEEKEAFLEFRLQVDRMLDDIQFMNMQYGENTARSYLLEGDARVKHSEIRNRSCDLALTSPPYLNNYDYADRTRLETYFFGWYHTWGEITENVRQKLMMSATTQVRRVDFATDYGLSDSLKELDPKLFDELRTKVHSMSERRKTKGGKKSYDCMVAGYFSDMVPIFQNVYDALGEGANFVLVLGDSAPYGVHIPTDQYLARLGLSIGFSDWKLQVLRKRGDKWRNNPQRHSVKLREVILTLTK